MLLVIAGGMYENWADSFAMLWRTPAVGIVNAVFFVSVIGLNVFGVAVTCTLGSVFRAVLLTSRTALVSESCPTGSAPSQPPSMLKQVTALIWPSFTLRLACLRPVPLRMQSALASSSEVDAPACMPFCCRGSSFRPLPAAAILQFQKAMSAAVLRLILSWGLESALGVCMHVDRSGV